MSLKEFTYGAMAQLEVFKTINRNFFKQIQYGCIFDHSGTTYILLVEDDRMFFYSTDLTDLSSTSVTSLSTRTFYSGFFAYKLVGNCAVKDNEVFVVNSKIWSFNLNTDGLGTNWYEYGGYNPQLEHKLPPVFPDSSSYFLVGIWTSAVGNAVIPVNEIYRGIVGDHSTDLEVIGDMIVMSLSIKPGSSYYMATQGHYNDESIDFYTKVWDFTSPMTLIRSRLNLGNSIGNEKINIATTPFTNEDIYGVASVLMRFQLRKWSDDTIIYQKTLSEILNYVTIHPLWNWSLVH